MRFVLDYAQDVFVVKQVGRTQDRYLDIDPAAIRAETYRRGLTAEELAARARLHRNTVVNILSGRTTRIEVETATRIAFAFQTVQPLAGIDAIRKASTKGLANRTSRVVFPIPIDPLVRQTLPDDAPVLVRERQWYREVTLESQGQWNNRVARFRSGNLAHARDFNFADVEAFLDELGESSRSGVMT